MELYVERGFENTTVAEIADRAGLTERTFFRHFADKREVLFSGTQLLQDLLAEGVAAAAAAGTGAGSPIDMAIGACEAVTPLFGNQRREWVRQRQSVIAATPELRERELVKLAAMASTIADALRRHGVREPAATLAAETCIAVFRVAFERWVSQRGNRTFSHHLRESFHELRALVASP